MLSLQMGQITWIITLRDWFFTVWGVTKNGPSQWRQSSPHCVLHPRTYWSWNFVSFDHLHPFPPPKTTNPTPPQPPISSLFKIYLLYPFVLNVSVAPYMKYISSKQHTYRWIFFNRVKQPLFSSVFISVTFAVITDIFGFKSTNYCCRFFWSYLFYISFFSSSCLVLY